MLFCKASPLDTTLSVYFYTTNRKDVILKKTNVVNFLLHKTLLEDINSSLDPEQQGEFFHCLLAYALNEDENGSQCGRLPLPSDPLVRLLFNQMIRQRERDVVEYQEVRERNRQNARSRGRRQQEQALNEDEEEPDPAPFYEPPAATVSDPQRLEADAASRRISLLNDIPIPNPIPDPNHNQKCIPTSIPMDTPAASHMGEGRMDRLQPFSQCTGEMEQEGRKEETSIFSLQGTGTGETDGGTEDRQALTLQVETGAAQPSSSTLMNASSFDPAQASNGVNTFGTALPAPVMMFAGRGTQQTFPSARMPNGTCTVAEAKAFIELNHLQTDAEEFVNHFNSIGWLDWNGRPIRDWRKVCSAWSKHKLTAPAEPTARPTRVFREQQFEQREYEVSTGMPDWMRQMMEKEDAERAAAQQAQQEASEPADAAD